MSKDTYIEVTHDDADRLDGPASTFTHPDEVVHNGTLGVAEKRRILAAWASDAHAVPNLPAMRQLDSGAIVKIDAVLAALRKLDGRDAVASHRPRPSRERRRSSEPRWIGSLRGRRDDDDDPPPCPAAASPPGVELELRRRRDAAWVPVAA